MNFCCVDCFARTEKHLVHRTKASQARPAPRIAPVLISLTVQRGETDKKRSVMLEAGSVCA